MTALLATVLLTLGLCLQAMLGKISPEAHRFVDALMVPVAVFGISGTRRAALGVGCAAGLLHDAWFEVGTFGANGFKRTLLAWGLGAAAVPLDFGHAGGRMTVGAALCIGDAILDLGVYRLLGVERAFRSPGELAVEAAATGLLTVLVGAGLDRLRLLRGKRHGA